MIGTVTVPLLLPAELGEDVPGYAVGVELLHAGRWREAEGVFRSWLMACPPLREWDGHRFEATCHLALSILRMADDPTPRWREADAVLSAALRLRPDHAQARLARANVRLRHGALVGGSEDARWTRQYRPFRGEDPTLTRLAWDGVAPLDGRRVVVWSNEGRGDILMVARYIPALKARGAGRVTLRLPAEHGAIAPLRGCPGLDDLVVTDGPGGLDPAADVVVPSADLPIHAGATVETIPAAPYLSADPGLVARWRSRLAGDEGLKVGLAWQGNPRDERDRLRSIPLPDFWPLAEVPGVTLYALQVGPGRQHIPWCPFPIADLTGEFTDPLGPFSDAAAAASCMDLVVVVDSAMLHVCGGLGLPTWAAIDRPGCWRWFDPRRFPDSTPWYPSLRLFRQPAKGDWTPVIARLAEELRLLARPDA